jgi:hypothetical protein
LLECRDEGVRGAHALGQAGFTFEYSATFGQAVAAAGKKVEDNDLLTSYGKSILFDYSYRYFYKDGYGKDYRLLNVKDARFDAKTKQIVMLANLLTFYQQKKICEEPDFKDHILKEYHIEPPLWIFVGSKVDPAKQESDIVSRNLARQGIRASAIHGGMKQQKRSSHWMH